MVKNLKSGGKEMDEFNSIHYGEQIDEAVNEAHTHTNMSALNRFGEVNDQPTFDGKPIASSLTGLLWFSRENNQPILTKEPPLIPQNIVPVGWLAASPGIFTILATINHSTTLEDYYTEFAENNRYAIKLWIVSEIARINVQIKSQLVDTSDGEVLAEATTMTNLTADGTPIPVWFENIFLTTRRASLSTVQNVISVMPLEFGVQIGIVSNPPNTLSFINPSFTGAGATERESTQVLSTLWDKVQELTKQIEVLKQGV